LKILQLIDSLNIGGAERMSVNMANSFSDANIENILVCTRGQGPLKQFLPPSTKFIELNKNSVMDLLSLLSLFKLIEKEKPSVLHSHSSSIYWSILVKILYPKVILIWHDHNGNRKFENNFILRCILPFVNGIIVVNQDLLNWSVKEFPSTPSTLIKNFPYLGVVKKEKKKEVIILHLANLLNPKDHLTLIESVNLLKRRNSIQFYVWCVGKDSNDDYSQQVKRKIKDYGLENTVTLLGSVLDTKAILEQVKIGVLCSTSEGLPVSLLEYGLAGLPVVVTDVGQCSEVLQHGELGLVVPPSDSHKLCDALEWHIMNIEESNRMGALFKQHIESEYGAHNFMNQYFEFIFKLKK
jgi:glycosyltransferase involved in cell wall biosynthesis